MAYNYLSENTQNKAMLVKRIVDEHYQPESHQHSMLNIFRNHVVKAYPMTQGTFYRLMRYAIKKDGYVGNGCNRVYKIKLKVES